MKYDNRIVAYLDILGFKDLLDKTVDNEENDVEEKIDAIQDVYKIIRTTWDLDEGDINSEYFKKAILKDREKKKKVVTIFSDTIVVSFLQQAESEIFLTLMELRWLIMNLAHKGVICRGALAYGKLIHTDKMIYGPALVEAYMTESKAALFPRVILTKELIQLAGKFKSSHNSPEEEVEYVEGLLKKDLDGMYYIDYFLGAQNDLDDEFDFPIYLEKMADMIRKGVKSRKPEVRIKYMWMKEKINEVIDLCKSKKTQTELIDSGNPVLAGAYKRLKRA